MARYRHFRFYLGNTAEMLACIFSFTLILKLEEHVVVISNSAPAYLMLHWHNEWH